MDREHREWLIGTLKLSDDELYMLDLHDRKERENRVLADYYRSRMEGYAREADSWGDRLRWLVGYWSKRVD